MDIMTTTLSKSLYLTWEEISKKIAVLLTDGGAEIMTSSLTCMAYILAIRFELQNSIP